MHTEKATGGCFCCRLYRPETSSTKILPCCASAQAKMQCLCEDDTFFIWVCVCASLHIYVYWSSHNRHKQGSRLGGTKGSAVLVPGRRGPDVPVNVYAFLRGGFQMSLSWVQSMLLAELGHKSFLWRISEPCMWMSHQYWLCWQQVNLINTMWSALLQQYHILTQNNNNNYNEATVCISILMINLVCCSRFAAVIPGKTLCTLVCTHSYCDYVHITV